MPGIIGFGDPGRTLEGSSRKSSESVSGVFPDFLPEFLPESPSRTGGMAQRQERCSTKARKLLVKKYQGNPNSKDKKYLRRFATLS